MINNRNNQGNNKIETSGPEKQVIVLADASKIGHVALAPVCDLSQVHVLLTDSRLSSEDAEPLADRGCTVIRA